MDYTIIRDIAVISDNGYETTELKYMQWGKNTPKYDLRKWKDGSPLRGVTMSDEEAKSLLSVLLHEFYEDIIEDLIFNDTDEDDFDDESSEEDYEYDENDDSDDEYDENDEGVQKIDYRTFFVRKSMDDCDREGHEYTDVIASVPMITDEKYKMFEFPAIYCYDCNIYYVTDEEYDKLHYNGRVLCQLLTEEEYRQYRDGFNNDNLSPRSVLNIFGYTVSRKDNLSDGERRQKLRWIIANGISTKERIVSYLNYFIKRSEGQTKLASAVSKWRADKDYLMGITAIGKDAPPMGVARFVRK